MFEHPRPHWYDAACIIGGLLLTVAAWASGVDPGLKLGPAMAVAYLAGRGAGAYRR